MTGAPLSTTISQNNARIIDLEAYDDNGTTRFAAIPIGNTGADNKAWWWVHDATSSFVNSTVTTNNARLTSCERYAKGGTDRFAAVMISSTGADARGWWYYYGQSAAQVTERLEQNAGRLIDVERYSTRLGTRYDIVFIDNANALEQTVRARFASGTDGAYGAFLKEVNGSILAQLRPDFVFEPASLLKTMYHVHAMRRVLLGLDSLSNSVTVSLGTSGSCPTGTGSSVNEPLETTLRKMMENSDNNRTYAVELRYGRANINATGAALGGSAAQINHTIGRGANAGAIANRLSLRDVDVLHEAVANGYLGTQREKFCELMANGLTFPTWGTSDLGTRIDAEAVALGMRSFVRDAFKATTFVAYKPGGYGVGGLLYFSEGGFVRVPFKDAQGAITIREFVFGSFNHGSTNDVASQNAMSDVSLELVWSQVRPALATWNNYTAGSPTTFGAGCPGSAGTALQTFSGTPAIHNLVNCVLGNAPGRTAAFFMVGFSNTSWNGARLPFSLATIGAPGCSLRIDPAATFNVVTDASGWASYGITFPNDTALIGNRLFSQYLVVDRPVNALGITATNGVTTLIGG